MSNKEKVVGGGPETTSPEKNFENRKGLAESRIKPILKELELGMEGQMHITPKGIIPIVVFVDGKPVEEEEVEPVQDTHEGGGLTTQKPPVEKEDVKE